MRLVLIWMGLMALVMGGCGDGTCSADGDCEAGSYCDDTRNCASDCSDANACPSGQACSSSGQCVAMQVDAGLLDAGPDEIDAGTDAGTEGGIDAGSPEEICTPSTIGSSPADEDGDGAIDEGCEWHFGVPHPVSETLNSPSRGGTQTSWVSSDGLRLVFLANTTGRDVLVATRVARDERFGSVAVLPIDSLPVRPYAFALSDDELEMIVQTPPEAGTPMDLYRAVRVSSSDTFDTWTSLSELNSLGHEAHPFLRRDGLEVLFASARTGAFLLYRSTRSARSEAFSGPEVLTVPGAVEPRGPALSADGRTLFFADLVSEGRLVIKRAHRTDPSSATFDAAVEVETLSVAGAASHFPTVSEATREIFFSSSAPWLPGVVWRAEICRDGPCPSRVVDCPASGIRSLDGLHCYAAADSPRTTRAGAAIACAAIGSHPPTLHSEGERAFVWGAFSWLGAFWLAGDNEGDGGAWRWNTGEPWRWDGWGDGQPDECDCTGGEAGSSHCVELKDDKAAPFGYAITPGGAMNDVACDARRPVVCERKFWPNW